MQSLVLVLVVGDDPALFRRPDGHENQLHSPGQQQKNPGALSSSIQRTIFQYHQLVIVIAFQGNMDKWWTFASLHAL